MNTLEQKHMALADKIAAELPQEYASFLSRCKHDGVDAAVQMCHLSENIGIIMLWAKKVMREHPEIK